MSKKPKGVVEFMGDGKYCRLSGHHEEARQIAKDSGGIFFGSSKLWKIESDPALHAKITEAATRDNAKRMATRTVLSAEQAKGLKVGEDFDFGDAAGVKPIVWISEPFEGKDVTFDPRFKEQDLVGKKAVYVYSDDAPNQRRETKARREPTPEEKATREAAARDRMASREIVPSSALAGLALAQDHDFGGDVGVKPVLWISAAFEAKEGQTDARFKAQDLVGKEVAYVYHANPPRRALEEAAKTDPAAAAALKIADGQAVEAPKAATQAPKTEAPKAEPAKAETPKAEAPKAEPVKAETPKAETPAPAATAPVEAAKAEAPKADAAAIDLDDSDMLNGDDFADLEGLDDGLSTSDLGDKFEDM